MDVLAAFLASVNSTASLLVFSPHHSLALVRVLHYAPASLLGRRYHSAALSILLCHCLCQSLSGSTGISTCCPSPTTSVLGLGPDLPWADEPSPGNLGLSTATFLALLSLLIPALSLVYSPPLLSVRLQPAYVAPLPLQFSLKSAASVARLSPGHFRRTTTRPVSYYALFKCMAASKPTSWLSVQFHILLHLTCTSGP